MKCAYCLKDIERVARRVADCRILHGYHTSCLRKWKSGGCPACINTEAKLNDLYVSDRVRYDDIVAMLCEHGILE